MFLKILNFLRKYALKHPLYVLVYGFGYFSQKFNFNIHFYSEEEIRSLLLEGKSLIRLGDGEINLLLDLKNHYQAFSPFLKKSVANIISSYHKETSYILSIPESLTISNKKLKEMNRFGVWMPFKVMFLLFFPRTKRYMDAHSFYRKGYFERVVAPCFLEKKVIIVTNGDIIKKLKSNTRLPWNNIVYIETPKEESLGACENIESVIKTELSKTRPESSVLFFALGPVGKLLLKNFSENGYQGIDVGRGIETMFTNESIESLI